MAKGQLIILVGVSASGKSTFSWTYMRTHKDCVIVSRDGLRKMLFGLVDNEDIKEYHKRPDYKNMEELISQYEHEIIESSLSKGKTVIIDNTNLKMEYIEKYKRYGVPTSVVVIGANKDECIKRDAERIESVGKDVIEKQWSDFVKICKKIKDSMKYKKHPCFNKDKPVKGVIWNIPYITFAEETRINSRPDFFMKDNSILLDLEGGLMGDIYTFYWGVKQPGFESPNLDVCDIINSLKDSGFKIVIYSERDETWREKIEIYLENNKIKYDHLYLKSKEDKRDGLSFKEDMWDKIENDYNIIAIIENRMKIVNRARQLGYTVLQAK